MYYMLSLLIGLSVTFGGHSVTALVSDALCVLTNQNRTTR